MPISADPARQGILWDLDGVLVDTGEYHFYAWKEVLIDYGISLDWASFRKTFGMNNASTLEILFRRQLEEDLVKLIGKRKEERFRQLIQGHIAPLPGVLDWLKWFDTHHFPMAVASSAPLENIDYLINALQIRPYFAYLVSGADLPGKPDPAVFLIAAQKLGLSPASSIVIEDSIAGVEAARQAGMRCIAVATTNPAQKLSGASLVVANLSELSQVSFLQLFNQINQ